MARCDSYDIGQCTRLVCDLSPWIPDYMGDAGGWLDKARELGMETGDVPVRGSIVVYGPNNGYSEFGHVAQVTAVHPDGRLTVRERNFTGYDEDDYRTSTTYDVLGYIYPPGGSTGPEGGGDPPPTEAGTVSISDAWAMLQNSLNSTLPVNLGWLGRAADQIRDLRGG